MSNIAKELNISYRKQFKQRLTHLYNQIVNLATRNAKNGYHELHLENIPIEPDLKTDLIDLLEFNGFNVHLYVNRINQPLSKITWHDRDLPQDNHHINKKDYYRKKACIWLCSVLLFLTLLSIQMINIEIEEL